ncbi:MAG: hypothetical protein JXA03_00210 [Bacteroidales bacterium]|nr:hypothetical protein [Bacteroidales bacterium]
MKANRIISAREHFARKVIMMFCLVAYCSIHGIAQGFDNTELHPKIVSPGIGQLGYYGKNAVNLSTGSVDVAIPIYTLNTGEFELPVAIRYNAGGIKVEDLASWVGLGWSLQAGGGISVTARGISDFNNKMIRIRTDEELAGLNHPQIGSQGNDTCYYVSQGILDSEPDVFNYNFCGYSGQFFLEGKDNYATAKFTKNTGGLKIEADIIHRSITATDPKGRKYYFSGEKAKTYSLKYSYYYIENIILQEPQGYMEDNYDTACYNDFFLDSITLENFQGSIYFDYVAEEVRHTTRLSGSISTIDPELAIKKWADAYENAFIKKRVVANSRRLVRIRFIKGSAEIQRIEFVPDGADRLDLAYTKALKRIEIWQGTTLINKWEFFYDYFQSPVTKIENIGKPNSNYACKRLKLTRLSNNMAAANPPEYKFIYFGDPGSSTPGITLPYRTSFDGYDHWGYCNKNHGQIDHAVPSKLFPAYTPLSGNDIHFKKFLCKGNSYLFPEEPQGLNSIPAFNHPLGDRKPVEYNTKAYTLETIVYPTGGMTLFEYELHYLKQYNSAPPSDTAGGLRIKRITDIPLNDDPVIRSFEYGKSTLYEEPRYISEYSNGFTFCGCLNVPPMQKNGYILNTNVVNNNNNPNVQHVTYAKATEVSGDQGTDYYFSHYSPVYSYPYKYRAFYADGAFPASTKRTGLIYELGPVFPFKYGYNSQEYKQGLSDSVIQFRQTPNGKIVVMREVYTYQYINPDTVFGNEFYLEPGSDMRFFWISAYSCLTGSPMMNSKTTTVWDQNGLNPVTTLVSYSYNNDFELLTGTVETQSDNSVKTVQITYPVDYSGVYSAPLSTMKSRYMINYPVETITRINEKVTQAGFVKYSYFGQKVRPEEVYKLESNLPLNDFLPSTQAGPYQIDPRYTLEMKYAFCPDQGTLLELQPPNGPVSAFLWGYNYTLLLATAENSTYSQLITALAQLGHTPAGLQGKTNAQLSSILYSLRNSPLMKDVMLTTCTHLPLTGISTLAGPSGQMTYYDYDSAGRLGYIRNNEGRYLNRYEYHYKNQ